MAVDKYLLLLVQPNMNINLMEAKLYFRESNYAVHRWQYFIQIRVYAQCDPLSRSPHGFAQGASAPSYKPSLYPQVTWLLPKWALAYFYEYCNNIYIL